MKQTSKRMRHLRNREEDQMLSHLQDAKLYQELMPAIRAVAKANGGGEAILKKSEALASLALVHGLTSEKADVRVKAAIEILNRTIGKPLERSVNIYGDISRMNEKDLDAQILRALEKHGAQPLVELAVQAKPKALPKPRKPRKSEPIEVGQPAVIRPEEQA